MKLMMIVNDPQIARYVAEHGVDRIFVDIESLGKSERQGHRDTWLSRHTMNDVSLVRESIGSSTLLVRLNPWYEGSAAEIEEAIARGADMLMLPMFRTLEEVVSFARLVRERVPVVPLAETAEAMAILSQVAHAPGITEMYIGLNDLHLSLGLRFMFEPLVNGVLDRAAGELCAARMPFGFGGLARVGEGMLPAERIVAEHIRLGSSCAILSRTFHRQASSLSTMLAEMNFPLEIQRIRDAVAEAERAEVTLLEQNRREVKQLIESIVERIS